MRDRFHMIRPDYYANFQLSPPVSVQYKNDLGVANGKHAGRVASHFLSPAAHKNVEKLVEAGIPKERAGTSNPKVFVAGEILRLLDEPLTETPTTR